MVNITRNPEVPDSLQYPATSIKAITTHTRRLELVHAGDYVDNGTYNGRYKQDDTKESLKAMFNHKCCYCEQLVEAGHVEHYRPKKKYWWLAYSWDNLLWICPACNSTKDADFDIQGTKVVFNNDYGNIHNFLLEYQELEKPKLLNPEVDDLSQIWTFDREGGMDSTSYRGDYTIKTAGLNRDFLKDTRKKLLDDFESDIIDELYEYLESSQSQEEHDQLLNKLRLHVEKFASKAHQVKEPFLAFRRYACFGLLNQIIMDNYCV